MQTDFVTANVVINAKFFNPTVFREHWLIRNGLINENSILQGSVFADTLANVETNDFSLLVHPPQLQFEPKLKDSEGKVVIEILGKIIRTIPHTPFIAVGVNFSWHLTPIDGNVHQLSSTLFGVVSSPILRQFEKKADALFGGYASVDILGCRLRLDAKPVQDESRTRLLFSFNFHRDITSAEPENEIVEYIKKWDELRGIAEGVISNAIEEA